MKKQENDGLGTIIEQALAEMPEVGKWQSDFLEELYKTILLIQGKVNFSSLARHSDLHEKTYQRRYRDDFDFESFNVECIKQRPVKGDLVAALDATYVSKSGKKTEGLGYFYNGCVNKTMKGLELSEIALIDQVSRQAYAFSAKQTIDTEDESRLMLYAEHVKSCIDTMPEEVKYLLTDGYYSKQPFVDAICGLDRDLELIGKLRHDADLKYLYEGEQSGVGRNREYDGKVYFNDFSRFDYEGEIQKDIHLYVQTVKHRTLNRIIRVVALVDRSDPDKPKHILLFSTDLKLSGKEILDLYRLRFQIEFLIRDAKQFTGLNHCQARDAEALDFHFNSSMSAVNLAKIDLQKQHQHQQFPDPNTPDFVFSLAPYKRQNFCHRLLKRLLSKLDLSLTSKKVSKAFYSSLDFGTSVL